MHPSPQAARSCLGRAVAVAAVLALLPLAAPAAPHGRDKARVTHARAVQGLEFAPGRVAEQRRAGPGKPGRSARAARLRFEADGRAFELELRENVELLEKLPEAAQERLRGDHELYAGEIVGSPGSWVRLTRSGGVWKGLVHDGDELLALEPASNLEAGPGEGLALYRADDVVVAGSCALDPGTAPLPSHAALASELDGIPTALGAATSQLDISLVGDVSFVWGEADPEGTALAVLNAVDGIYAHQVGVSLRVVNLVMLESDAGLTSSSARTLLDQLAALTGTGAIANPGLVHLLTGRDLDGSTVGVAYLNALCHTRYGIGLSQMLSGSLVATTVLVAHEIGHNFGAPHDDEAGSSCGSTPVGFIMSPRLNASAEQFSACSLGEMASEIAGASCLVEVEEELPACSNGIDDDGDGAVDWGEDLNCLTPDDPSEDLDCRDGQDNDADGRVDWPDDPECLSADQWKEDNAACGIGFEIVPALLPILVLRRRRARARPTSRPARGPRGR